MKCTSHCGRCASTYPTSISKIVTLQPRGSRIRKNSGLAQLDVELPDFLRIRLQIDAVASRLKCYEKSKATIVKSQIPNQQFPTAFRLGSAVNVAQADKTSKFTQSGIISADAAKTAPDTTCRPPRESKSMARESFPSQRYCRRPLRM